MYINLAHVHRNENPVRHFFTVFFNVPKHSSQNISIIKYTKKTEFCLAKLLLCTIKLRDLITMDILEREVL